MDSMTQAALGAAVGHVCWQDKLGRKALLAGAVLGTLPDLDVLLYPLLDDVQRLYWHRGESHSVWFLLLGAMAAGGLAALRGGPGRSNPYQAAVGVVLVLGTHILIDLFNVYGTQLLAPVTRESFALNNMFIIDPLFTVPLLAGTTGAFFIRSRAAALGINRIGLSIALLYAAWSFSAQAVAGQKFRAALAELDYAVSRQSTSASPFNTLLWRHIAETPEGFLLGYWSWLDDRRREIRFQFIPKNAALVEPVRSTRAFAAVDWFSRGWWFALQRGEATATVVDLRFTEIPAARGRPYTEWQWPFAWTFALEAGEEAPLRAVQGAMAHPAETLKLLGRRIQGRDGWLTPAEQGGRLTPRGAARLSGA